MSLYLNNQKKAKKFQNRIFSWVADVSQQAGKPYNSCHAMVLGQ